MPCRTSCAVGKTVLCFKLTSNEHRFRLVKIFQTQRKTLQGTSGNPEASWMENHDVGGTVENHDAGGIDAHKKTFERRVGSLQKKAMDTPTEKFIVNLSKLSKLGRATPGGKLIVLLQSGSFNPIHL